VLNQNIPSDFESKVPFVKKNKKLYKKTTIVTRKKYITNFPKYRRQNDERRGFLRA